MGLKNLQLIFDHPQQTYYDGQIVSGRLLLQIDEPKRFRCEYDDETLHNLGATRLLLATSYKHTCKMYELISVFSRFGGLVVGMLASGTQDRGFAHDQSRWIFFG
jgi:hypothetical protein